MAKRPSAKQIAARRKFVAAVRAGKFRKRKTKTRAKKARPNPVRKKKKAARKNPATKPAFGLRKFVVRATYATGKGYRYYYLRGNDWRGRKGDATRYSKQAGRRRIVAIKNRLEPEISTVTLEEA